MPQHETVPIEQEPEQDFILISEDPDNLDAIAGTESTMALNNIAAGSNPVDALNQVGLSRDFEQTEADWKGGIEQERITSIEKGIETSTAEESAENFVMMRQNIDGEFGDDGVADENIKALNGVQPIKDDASGDLAIQTLVRNQLSAYNTDKTTFEAIGSFMGILTPERKSFLMYEVLDDLGFESSFMDVVPNDTDNIRRFREFYRKLGNENKARVVKAVGESINTLSSNPLIKSELFGNLVGPEFEGEEYSTLFNILDLSVVADVGILAKVGVKTLTSGASILSAAHKFKKADVAAKIIKATAKDPEAAVKAGVTPAATAKAVDATIPTSARALVTGVPDDIATGIIAKMDMQDRIIDDLANEELFNGVQTSAEQTATMQRTQLMLEADEDIKDASIVIERINDTKFKMSYTKIKRDRSSFNEGKGRNIGKLEVDEEVFFQQDGVYGLANASDQFPNGMMAWDPNAKSTGGLRTMFVSAIERIMPLQSRVKAGFDDALKVAFKDLEGNFVTGKNTTEVMETLMKGDDLNKVWQYDELLNGVDGMKPRTPKQIEAYFAVRNVLDQLGAAKGKLMADNQNARGVKYFSDKELGNIPAQAYDNEDAARAAFMKNGDNDSPHISIMDNGLQKVFGEGRTVQLGKSAELTKEKLAEAYRKGYQLVKADNGSNLFIRGQRRTQWALVKANKLHTPRADTAMRMRAGYMPKSRENSNFFIKTKVDGGLSGNSKATVLKTSAYSDNLADAQKYADDMNQNNDGKVYEVFNDRQLTQEQASYDSANAFGSMYGGARKTEELKYVGTGSSKRVDALASLQGYVNHIGTQMPINLYRLGLEKTAIETAKNLGMKDILTLEDLITKGKASKFDSNTQKLFQMMYDQVAMMRGIPSTAERQLSDKLRDIGNALDKSLGDIPILKKVPRVIHNMAGKGTQPQDYARGISFNTLLGMYNPAQFLVQASGAFVSFGINPIYTFKALPRYIGFQTLDQMPDPVARAGMIKWMDNNGLGDYADGYEIWRQSGLADNIVNSNADYTSVFTKQLPYDAGVVRKFLSNHTWFYKQGELANTRVAFSTAVERYKDINKVKRIDPNDKEAVEAIMARTEVNRLNMSRANQSDLNRGMKAVPLQFQQVISKYYEKVMPQLIGGTDELTGIEKMRLFGVTSALTGIAGVPLAESIAVKMMEMNGMSPDELSPETAIAFNYGAVGYLMKEGFNLNSDISTRMTLGVDWYKSIVEFTSQGHNLVEIAGGPAAGVSKRAAKQWQFLTKAIDAYTNQADTTSYEDLAFIGNMIYETSTDFITTTKNIKRYQAYLWGDNPSLRVDGAYKLDFRDMNEQTAFFGMIGFAPSEMSELYEIKAAMKADSGSSGGTSPFFTTEAAIALRIINTKVLGTDETQSVVGSKAISLMMHNKSAQERIDFLDRISSLAWDRKLDRENLFYKYIQEQADGFESSFGKINVEMSKAREARR